MEEIIKITVKDGESVVSARDLYDFLDLKERFSRFIERSFEYGFKLNVDYTPYQSVHPHNNQPFTDYVLTLDCAKHISMIQRTDKGMLARDYFIRRDKELSAISKYRVPLTYAEALRELADKTEKEEKLSKALEQAKPKVDFFDQVADSKDAIDLGVAAKSLNCGIGRNKLFEFLRDKSVLMANNIPYQSYCDKGWFRVIEQKYSKPDGTIHITTKTLLYQKGLQAISKMLSKPTEKNL